MTNSPSKEIMNIIYQKLINKYKQSPEIIMKNNNFTNLKRYFIEEKKVK